MVMRFPLGWRGEVRSVHPRRCPGTEVATYNRAWYFPVIRACSITSFGRSRLAVVSSCIVDGLIEDSVARQQLPGTGTAQAQSTGLGEEST
jgi:hypothetical protein